MEIFGTIKDVLKTIFVKSVIKIRPKFSLYLFSAHSFLFFCHFYFNYLSLFLLGDPTPLVQLQGLWECSQLPWFPGCQMVCGAF